MERIVRRKRFPISLTSSGAVDGGEKEQDGDISLTVVGVRR
jgi:hypothetical protein